MAIFIHINYKGQGKNGINTFILIPFRVNLKDQEQISGSLVREKMGFDYYTGHKEIFWVIDIQLTLQQRRG